MYLSLTYAAHGDNYEAIERCLKCLKLCRVSDNLQQEVSFGEAKQALSHHNFAIPRGFYYVSQYTSAFSHETKDGINTCN